ncbi:hypothetical protein GCM10009555_073270 [Acrocarpospora macrocephala]|uniref:Uncharacterized protein n=1 Tax=Acrocarpospora macrocephala TaxID=150177 RepID=A0A5M3WIJ8_9ACTN|nr:hypothetical protein Amac_021220 [Acrocarpospora macrocephala]
MAGERIGRVRQQLERLAGAGMITRIRPGALATFEQAAAFHHQFGDRSREALAGYESAESELALDRLGAGRAR